MAIKDFNPAFGDSAYTVGIVGLLLECVELSYRPGNLFIRFLCFACKRILLLAAWLNVYLLYVNAFLFLFFF